MQLQTHQTGSHFVVKLLSARLDAAHATSFRSQMNQFVADGHQHIVVDLTDVQFVDSSGLSALISTLKQMGDERHLALAGPTAPVLSLLKLTRFDKIVAIYPDSATALGAP